MIRLGLRLGVSAPIVNLVAEHRAGRAPVRVRAPACARLRNGVRPCLSAKAGPATLCDQKWIWALSA